jgi:hypothetical protein
VIRDEVRSFYLPEGIGPGFTTQLGVIARMLIRMSLNRAGFDGGSVHLFPAPAGTGAA